MCDRVTIIRQGVAVQSGTLDELRTTTRTAITVSTERPIEALEDRNGVHSVRSEDGWVHFEVDNAALGEAVAYVASFGIESLVSQPPTLEELFLREYHDVIDTAPGSTV